MPRQPKTHFLATYSHRYTIDEGWTACGRTFKHNKPDEPYPAEVDRKYVTGFARDVTCKQCQQTDLWRKKYDTQR